MDRTYERLLGAIAALESVIEFLIKLKHNDAAVLVMVVYEQLIQENWDKLEDGSTCNET